MEFASNLGFSYKIPSATFDFASNSTEYNLKYCSFFLEYLDISKQKCHFFYNCTHQNPEIWPNCKKKYGQTVKKYDAK